MADDEKQDEQEQEQAYPGHGPHSDGPSPERDESDSIAAEVDPGYVRVGGNLPEDKERAAAVADGESIDESDDEDDEPEEPADDSPIHDEDTIRPGDSNPAL